MRTQPETLTTLDLETGAVEVDGSNYLVDPDKWTQEFAELTARRQGITLVALHWDVIGFMREFQSEHGVAADARFVIRYLGESQGLTKSDAKKRLFELFPYGYVRQACKIAGMKQPRAWSTG